MTQEEYAKSMYNHCPSCRSNQISGGDIDIEGNECYQEVSCLECGAKWLDKYKLIGFEMRESKDG